MRRREDEVGSGDLFVWGETGLETASSPAPAEPAEPDVEETWPPEGAFPSVEIEFEVVPPVSRSEVVPTTPPSLTGAMPSCAKPKRAEKLPPRRQRHQFSTDEDYCNDPEELIRRAQERKKARKSAGDGPSLFMRAAGALARRDYSKKDLSRKLKRNLRDGETKEEADAVLERLESAGYLSDERYAEHRARTRSGSLGNARIRRELAMNGVSREHIDRALDMIEEPEELRAYRVWKRRYDELPTDRKERDRQIRYLLYRGFSMSSVSKVLRGDVEDPDEADPF